jgi:hypothetical protein
MKKKIILFLCACVITGIITSIAVSNNSLSENKFVLKNAQALTREDNEPIHAAEYKITCGTPLGNNGKSCEFELTTCQGITSGTCTQVLCPNHD